MTKSKEEMKAMFDLLDQEFDSIDILEQGIPDEEHKSRFDRRNKIISMRQAISWCRFDHSLDIELTDYEPDAKDMTAQEYNESEYCPSGLGFYEFAQAYSDYMNQEQAKARRNTE